MSNIKGLFGPIQQESNNPLELTSCRD